MLKLGKTQNCKILREKDFGVFVGNEGKKGFFCRFVRSRRGRGSEMKSPFLCIKTRRID